MKLVNIANDNRKLYLFLRDNEGKLEIKEINSFFPYFYEPDTQGSINNYDGIKLRKVFISDLKQMRKIRSNNAYEGDLKITNRYLIDAVDKLEKCPIKIAYLDIEVQAEELPDVTQAKYPITCISIGNSFTKTIKTFWIKNYNSEYELIESFIKYMKEEQFDIIMAWNISFDYDYLYNRIPDFAKRISPIGQTCYGNGEVEYPSGISLIDYLGWFKKITLNREEEYSLDYIAQKHLGDKEWGKTDFGKVTDDIKEKNINDVRRMVKLEEKFKIVDYFDEIRRLSKVEWKDLLFNSRTLDMLLLQEAKNQKIALPMKPSEERGTLEDKVDYEGAYREAFETGVFHNLIKCDLSSAYPSAIIDFCLDPSNIVEEESENTVKIEGNNFKQNPNAILPTVVKKLLVLKNNIKDKLETLNSDTPEYINTKILYNAIKSIVNSAYGIFGSRFFRLYNNKVASATTHIVRNLLQYVKEQIELKGYKVIYSDTDSLLVDNKEDLTDILNDLIKQWYKEKWGKEQCSVKFSYEGMFTKLLILAKCRYFGYLQKPNGDIEQEVCGVEIKRKDSTVFMKKFQEELMNKILDKEPKENIIAWIKQQIIDIKKAPLQDIAFPCKLGRDPDTYVSVPIFVRALDYAKELNEKFNKKLGERYYYIYTKPFGYETKEIETTLLMTYDKNGIKKGFKNLTDKRLQTSYAKNNVATMEELLEKGLLKVEKVEKKGKSKNVLAFDAEEYSHINRDNIDWSLMIERNILNKLDVIFTAMNWDIKEIL